MLQEMLQRVSRGDEAAVLDEAAVSAAAELSGLLREDDGDMRSRFLLGWLHWHRYRALSEDQGTQDLRAAVTMLAPCLAVGAGPLPVPLLPVLADALVPVATSLLEQAYLSSDGRLHTVTVRLWRQIMTATPAEHPGRAVRLSNVGSALFALSRRGGVAADLDEAVERQREAVAATPAGNPGRAGQLSNLGGMLRERFARTGAQGDLDLAIAVGREAVAATPADHEGRAMYLSNLGAALHTRFVRSGAARRPTRGTVPRIRRWPCAGSLG